MKKLLSLLLALLLLLLVACANEPETADQGTADQEVADQGETGQEETGQEETDQAIESDLDPITLTWWHITGVDNDTPVFQELARRTGVTIDFSINDGVGDPNERLAVLMAGGDMPDFVSFASNFGDIQERMLGARVMRPLDDIIHEYGPNIIRNAPLALGISQLVLTDDTHQLFQIPLEIGGDTFNEWRTDDAWFMRWDLYVELGFPPMNTLEEMLDVVEAMLELEPYNVDGLRNYGIGMAFAEGWFNLVVDKPILFFQGVYSPGLYAIMADIRDNKIICRLTDPDNVFWDSMRAFNLMYRRGLMDPESSTMTFDQMHAKGMAGRYMLAPCSWTYANSANAQFVAQGTPEKGFVPFLVEPAEDGVMYLGDWYPGGSHMTVFISTSNDHPERSLAFIDYLFTEDGVLLTRFGFEGEHWDLVDGYVKPNPETVEARQADPDFGRTTGIGVLQFLVPQPGMVHPERGFSLHPLHPEHYLASLFPVQRAYMEHFGFTTFTEMFTNAATNDNYRFPGELMYGMSIDGTSDLGMQESSLNALLETSYARIIFQPTEEDFNREMMEFIDRAIAIGIRDIVAEYYRMYEYNKLRVDEFVDAFR